MTHKTSGTRQLALPYIYIYIYFKHRCALQLGKTPRLSTKFNTTWSGIKRDIPVLNKKVYGIPTFVKVKIKYSTYCIYIYTVYTYIDILPQSTETVWASLPPNFVIVKIVRKVFNHWGKGSAKQKASHTQKKSVLEISKTITCPRRRRTKVTQELCYLRQTRRVRKITRTYIWCGLKPRLDEKSRSRKVLDIREPQEPRWYFGGWAMQSATDTHEQISVWVEK